GRRHVLARRQGEAHTAEDDLALERPAGLLLRVHDQPARRHAVLETELERAVGTETDVLERDRRALLELEQPLHDALLGAKAQRLVRLAPLATPARTLPRAEVLLHLGRRRARQCEQARDRLARFAERGDGFDARVELGKVL